MCWMHRLVFSFSITAKFHFKKTHSASSMKSIVTAVRVSLVSGSVLRNLSSSRAGNTFVARSPLSHFSKVSGINKARYFSSSSVGMEPFKFEGLVIAPFTPFDKDGNVDLSAIDRYQQYLVKNGMKNLYINGSTGESKMISVDERKQIAEKWMEFSRMPGREAKVFIHVGVGSFKDVEELTKHAVQLGADAIATLPQIYYPPNNVDELVDFLRTVGEMAPNTPLYYYHNLGRTHVNFDMEIFLQKCAKRAPTLRGVKYAAQDMYEGNRMSRTLDANGHPYDLIFSKDEEVLASYAAGFKNSIGYTYNFMPQLYIKLKAAFDQGNIAQAQQYQNKSVDVVKLLKEYGSRCGGIIPAEKVMMEAIGVSVGPPRYPLTPLEDDEKKELLDRMRKLGGFDEHISL